MRAATPDDVGAMAEVELHTALTAYAPIFPPDAPVPTLQEFTDRWHARLAGQAGVGVFVACAGPDEADAPGGPLLGLVMADPDPAVDPDPEHHGHLRALYVHPDHWGEGIGHRLHDRAMEHLRAHRPRLGTVSLWVMERNPSRAIYERWGWKLTTDRQEIWPGVDELRYERPL